MTNTMFKYEGDIYTLGMLDGVGFSRKNGIPITDNEMIEIIRSIRIALENGGSVTPVTLFVINDMRWGD